MSHLNLETIARIVDDGPSAEENRHLDACSACRAELEAMQEDVHALRMLPDVAPAADDWAALEQRLVAEGLVHSTRRITWFTGPHLMQAAAAVVLFLGGTLAGRGMIPHAPATVAQQTPAPPPPSAQPPASLAANPEAGDVAPEATQPEPTPVANPNVTLASNGFSRSAQPRTPQEAAAMLREAEDIYLTLLTRYAELATQSDTGDPVARLAALQSIVMTTQAALNQAPTDPVINGYHLTALAQRDATLRQVASTTSDTWY